MQRLTRSSGRANANANQQLRIKLAHALGHKNYPEDTTATAHLNYIANRQLGRGTLGEYLKLFIRIIEYFSTAQVQPATKAPTSRNIRELLDDLVSSDHEALFMDTKPGSAMRKEDVEDTTMYIMGTWALMLSSFEHLPSGFRKVTMAWNARNKSRCTDVSAYDQSLGALIGRSSLLPEPHQQPAAAKDDYKEEVLRAAIRLVKLLNVSEPTLQINSATGLFPRNGSAHSLRSLEAMDSLESLSVKATRVNAFTLHTLGAVKIAWTRDISRHMMLSRMCGQYVLEIFAIPCAFMATTLSSGVLGISTDLAQEIQESYCILFNAWPETSTHARFWGWVGIRRFCFCWSCSAYRYRRRQIDEYRNLCCESSKTMRKTKKAKDQSEYDPLLVELMNSSAASDWTQDVFPCLWSRIVELEEHLQASKPWNIWILFRDRRDTLQFWTFCFATVVLLLTFLQVVLGVVQAVGSFR